MNEICLPIMGVSIRTPEMGGYETFIGYIGTKKVLKHRDKIHVYYRPRANNT